MNHVSRLSTFALIAAASLPSLAAGTLSAHSTSATPLSASGGVETTVLELSVPAGAWIVAAKASAVNWLNKDYNRCRVMAGADEVDGATTMTGELDGMPAVATVSNLGTISTTVRTTFKLNCWHDFDVPNQYIDPGASLLVTRAPK